MKKKIKMDTIEWYMNIFQSFIDCALLLFPQHKIPSPHPIDLLHDKKTDSP